MIVMLNYSAIKTDLLQVGSAFCVANHWCKPNNSLI